jgi:hypothetical protein
MNEFLEREQLDPGWIVPCWLDPDIPVDGQNFRRAEVDPGPATSAQLDPGYLREAGAADMPADG